MPKTKAEDLNEGPFPQSLVVRLIEQAAAAQGYPEGKQIAGLIDAKPNWWTRRRNCESALSLPELSLLAKHLAPDAPWKLLLDEYHQRALARGLAELAREAAGSPSPASPTHARPGRRGGKGVTGGGRRR